MTESQIPSSNSNDSTRKEIQGQDGGFPGWIAVLSLWTSSFIWTGFVKGLGIMLPTLQHQFGIKTAVIGWMISMIGTTLGLIGPFAGVIGRRFGTGVVVMMCGLMIGVSAVIGSLSTTAVQLTVILTLLSGTGLGVTDVLVKEAVGRRFNKNFVTALCIGKSGTSIGMLVFAPVIQLFLDTYGWRGTMLLIGGISFHIVVCGALLVKTGKNASRLNNDYQVVSQDEHLSEHEAKLLHRCSALWKHVAKNLDLGLLQNYRYWLVTCMFCCTQLSFEMWIVYFVSMAQSKGFSPKDAATFVTVAGVGHLIARMIQGFLLERWVKSYFIPMVILTSTASAMFYATPWLTWYWSMMMSSVLILFCVSAVLCLFDVLYKQLLGVDLLAGAIGWAVLTIAIIRFSIVFLPGWLYDVTGSYNGAFIFIGIVQSLSLIPLLILRYLKLIE